LPELEEQQAPTLTLIDVSQRNGQSRMVEMNKQILTNLDRMITEIEKTAATEDETPHAASGVFCRQTCEAERGIAGVVGAAEASSACAFRVLRLPCRSCSNPRIKSP
jgi:hypothetical protein